MLSKEFKEDNLMKIINVMEQILNSSEISWKGIELKTWGEKKGQLLVKVGGKCLQWWGKQIFEAK